MSLINKMLDELEKNRKRKDPRHEEALSGIKPIIRKQKTNLGWKIAYWIIILTIAISIIWYQHPSIIINISKTVTTLQKKFFLKKPQKKQLPLPTAPATPTTIKLQDITLEQKDNRTILDFVLSSPTPYYIEHGSEQQLFITLGNATLPGNLPVFLENSFITTLDTKQNNTGVTTTLSLLPGTKIDELQLMATPQPHLHLVFSNQQLTGGLMTKKITPVSPEQQAAEQYQEIQLLLSQNQTSEAITKLHLFISEYPSHLPAREILASLLIKNGQLQRAANILTIGLNRYQGYSPFIKLQAYILAQENSFNAAINLLEKYLSATDDVEYLALLAALYQQQGYSIQAAELYNQLTKIQPQKTAWWLGLGISLENAGKKNAAKEAYLRARDSSDVPYELQEFLNDRIKK